MSGDQRPAGGPPEPEPHEPARSEPEPHEPARSEPEPHEPARSEPDPHEPGQSEPEHKPEQPEKSEPGTSHGSGMRAVIAALGANLGIAVVKFAAFLVTGSASMLAESVHSVADSGNQALLLL